MGDSSLLSIAKRYKTTPENHLERWRIEITKFENGNQILQHKTQDVQNWPLQIYDLTHDIFSGAYNSNQLDKSASLDIFWGYDRGHLLSVCFAFHSVSF